MEGGGAGGSGGGVSGGVAEEGVRVVVGEIEACGPMRGGLMS